MPFDRQRPKRARGAEGGPLQDVRENSSISLEHKNVGNHRLEREVPRYGRIARQIDRYAVDHDDESERWDQSGINPCGTLDAELPKAVGWIFRALDERMRNQESGDQEK